MPEPSELRVEIVNSLEGVPAADWDALGRGGYPFTRHAFLLGLEQHDCLEPFGWYPVHFLLYREARLIAAVPCYIKSNSYGELVFDHAWVNAYHRSGLEYYPKLVTAIPYTPATGPRFLLDEAAVPEAQERQLLRETLCQVIKEFCAEQEMSSWHVLFAEKPVLEGLAQRDLMLRSDVQFHWQNDGYADFDAFLGALSSRKRKNLRKERREIAAQPIEIDMTPGGEISEADWRRIYSLYAGIYQRKYGTATLTPGFFLHLGKTMPDQVLAAITREQGQVVAASLFFRSDTHLYGRVWGCDGYYPHLHFESCYYQGIDYCIREGLQTFDPGAQGEHKLARGFLPTQTWSGHWIAHPQFREAIEQFLQQELRHIDSYRDDLLDHSPYRRTDQ